jgi:hypothetical protein
MNKEFLRKIEEWRKQDPDGRSWIIESCIVGITFKLRQQQDEVEHVFSLQQLLLSNIDEFSLVLELMDDLFPKKKMQMHLVPTC